MATMFIVQAGETIILQAVSSENPNLVYLKGNSAYDIAVKEGGFEGTSIEWLASLSAAAILVAKACTTEERNSLDSTVIGEHVFDITLNKPIWRNASNDGWVDALGAPI